MKPSDFDGNMIMLIVLFMFGVTFASVHWIEDFKNWRERRKAKCGSSSAES